MQKIEEYSAKKIKNVASEIKVDSRDFVTYQTKCIKGKLMKRNDEVD